MDSQETLPIESGLHLLLTFARQLPEEWQVAQVESLCLFCTEEDLEEARRSYIHTVISCAMSEGIR